MFRFAITVATGILSLATVRAADPARPNVLLILADDMGFSDAGCYGGEIATPNLDALAASGVRFTSGYAACPVCSPTRAAILTGKAPHEINQIGIARVFQTPEIFPDLPVLHNVMAPAFAKRDGAFRVNLFQRLDTEHAVREEAEALLQDVGLFERRIVNAGALSRGDKRRLELAMCLVQEPKLLLLDEPTAGMSRADTERTIELLKRIGERRITKIIIEHDMQVVFSLANRISVLAQGSVLAEGDPASIRGDARVQEAYLGGKHL